MKRKLDNPENIYKLVQKEFPEHRKVADHLIKSNEFTEMVQEYMICARTLEKLKDLASKKRAYRELKKELKEEINNYIIRHIPITENNP